MDYDNCKRLYKNDHTFYGLVQHFVHTLSAYPAHYVISALWFALKNTGQKPSEIKNCPQIGIQKGRMT